MELLDPGSIPKGVPASELQRYSMALNPLLKRFTQGQILQTIMWNERETQRHVVAIARAKGIDASSNTPVLFTPTRPPIPLTFVDLNNVSIVAETLRNLREGLWTEEQNTASGRIRGGSSPRASAVMNEDLVIFIWHQLADKSIHKGERWRKKNVGKILFKEYGVDLTDGQIGNILHKTGLKLKKTQKRVN